MSIEACLTQLSSRFFPGQLFRTGETRIFVDNHEKRVYIFAVSGVREELSQFISAHSSCRWLGKTRNPRAGDEGGFRCKTRSTRADKSSEGYTATASSVGTHSSGRLGRLMKTFLLPFSTILIAISLFTLLISGCLHPTQPTERPAPEYAAFAIDLQNGFHGDSVIIKLDGQVLYDRLTTTDSSNGFAFRLVPAVSAGTHQIHVSIPVFSVQADTMLDVQDTLVLGINFDRGTRRFSFIPYDTWLAYGGCGGIDPLIVPEPSYDSPIWHPSGRFIGFNHTPLRGVVYPEPCYPEQVFDYNSTGFWLINTDGTNMRRIFAHTLLCPAWSPDGQWIAFCVPIGNEVHIFKMRFTGDGFDTTTLAQLTKTGRNFYPAWSPDGKWIAYDRSIPDESGPAGIWRMGSNGLSREALFAGSFPAWDASGSVLLGVIGISPMTAGTKLVRYSVTLRKAIDTISLAGDDNRIPRYSPDGTTIAFWSNGNIWMMDSDGTDQQQLTTSGVDVSFGLPFSWSPDGSKIIYTRYPYRSTDWTIRNGVLWMIDVNTGTEIQFTFNN